MYYLCDEDTECPFCANEDCSICGNSVIYRTECPHDVIDRHKFVICIDVINRRMATK